MASRTIKENAKADVNTVGEVLSVVAESKKEIKQKIYVGPSIPGLAQYTVVETGFTEHIQKIIETCPAVKKLFVSIGAMAETEMRIKQKGTLEYRNFNQVVAFKNGKGDN